MRDRSEGFVVAIVVTYQPDLDALSTLLGAIQQQVDAVVLVDNGSDRPVEAWLARAYPGYACIPLGRNLGIAKAQNVGIAWAKERRASHVVLFDQDSHPAPDMVERLLSVAHDKALAGIRVAGVGPRYLDKRQENPPPFIQIKGLRVERQHCAGPDAVVDVDYLIASGCLIPMTALDAVGDMREALFIDYVDIEWGLRARRAGYRSFGACGAHMSHDLGDEPIEFFGRKIPLHSPLRHYYHFRNAIWLYRQAWAPRRFKLADGWRLLLKYGFYTAFAAPRYQQWRMMSLGIWHGLIGRMGRLGSD